MTRFLIVAAIIAAVVGGSTLFGLPPPAQGDTIPNSAISITDGDTFRIGDERIRISNIDTPEMGDGAECQWERDKAQEAKNRLTALLRTGTIQVQRSALDRFRRTLANVSVNGRDVGEILISEGLAVRWAGRQNEWC